MLNERLLEMYGEQSRTMLDDLCNAIGTDVVTNCSVISEFGSRIINGVKMPDTISIPEGSAKIVTTRIKEFLSKFGGETNGAVINVMVDDRRPTNVPLWLPFSELDCGCVVNPIFGDLYGKASVPMLQAFINILGDKVAPTVKVIRKCGCKFVNGVKMPNMISTESTQCNYVESCVKKFYSEWGMEALDETIEVTTERMLEGDIPLCVANEKSDTMSAFSKAFNLMRS